MTDTTPRPWRVSDAAMDGFRPIMGSGGAIVALVSTLSESVTEDARLIAAAPDLLEALKLADATLRGVNMNRSYVARKVGAALNKATGAE